MNHTEPRLVKQVAAAIYRESLTLNQFRLFQLSPGLDDDPIQGILQTVNFESKPQYEAVSYKWGDHRGRSVICDSEILPVNANLYFALQRFRLPTQPRLLWIDETCINQDDRGERGREVQIFHRIHAEAEKVLIWLGPGSEDSDVAMDFFPRIMSHLSDKSSKQEITDPDLPSLNNAAYKTPKMIALNNLLSRPWFSRVWTLQEGAFATCAVVVCGEKELSFSLFEEFNTRCEHDKSGMWTDTLSSISTAKPSDPKKPSRSVTAHIHGISKLKQVRLGKGPTEPVPSLLYRLRSCEATDARDRVYAMWSFLPESYLQTLKTPRYENEFTAADLFHQVAVIELIHNQNLDFLGHAGLWQQRPDIALSSWAADWSYRQLTHPLCVLDHDCLQKTGVELYRASRNMDGSARLTRGLNILTVRGKVLGDIIKLTSPFKFTTSHEKGGSTISSTSPVSNAEERTAEDERKAQVTHLETQLEYPIRIFNETLGQNALCFETAEQYHPYPHNVDIKAACMHTLTASLTHHIAGPAPGATLVRVGNEELEEMFTALDAAAKAMKTFNLSGIDKKAMKLLGLVREVTRTRRFLVTVDGYMGLAPGEARIGDRVAIVYGCSTPLLIRKVIEAEANWRLVGECYVYGLMDGEAIMMDDIQVEDIRLI